MAVIEVEGLRKRYRSLRGGTLALDGLSFEVPSGGIFGFLGPNGAGKTTTIRCLLRHVAPTSGSARVLGVDVRQLHQVLDRIGATVEAPGFFLRFSAIDNLAHLGALVGKSVTEAEELIGRVGLAGREGDRVATYSTGMKQRLALAAALLKDPELLILDEPAQGLDPEGIRDIRELLRELREEGRSVFLSSHLLAELEAVCDRVAIVNKGECLRQGAVDEILSEMAVPKVIVVTKDPEHAREVLRGAGFQATIASGDVTVEAEAGQASRINQILSEAGIFADEVRRDVATLEQAYLKWSTGE